MKKLLSFLAVAVFLITVQGCKKDGCTDVTADNYDAKADNDDGTCTYNNNPNPTTPKLRLKFKFDGTQERLDNFGNPVTVPAGHGALTPTFNVMGAHYIELSKKNDIPAYNGTELYESPMTTQGGSSAIVFDSALYGGDNEEFFSMDLADVPAGTYKYLRISLSYQNYDLPFRISGVDYTGTLASFVGANTYIGSYTLKDEVIAVNGNKLQGYWGFETHNLASNNTAEGQAAGTTVPNPIATTSAIPPGSCLVTGIFPNDFTITGNETEDITIVCSVSINNSLEWSDSAGNNIYEPLDGDTVVDMGVRGLIPIVQ